MSYLVLARRERPQSFSEIAGQRHVVQTLQNALRSGRIHHAYLFTGTRGVGKTSTARILAKALNCERGPTPDPCGTCGPCVDIREGRCVDVIEIDAATHRGIDDAKELLSAVSYLPSRCRFKVYVVDEVHMLSREAFNALLKTLEEPPAHVKFVFATTEPHKIPPTIGSRCQWFDFKALGAAEIDERLRSILGREGVEATGGALAILTREAAGSMRDAQSLLDQVLAFTEGGAIGEKDVREVLGLVERERIVAIAQAVGGKDADTALRQIAEAAAYGCDLRLLVRSLAETFRAIAIQKSVKDPAAVLGLPAADLAELAQVGRGIEREEAIRILGILLRCDADLARTAFPQIVVETAVLKALVVAQTVPLAEVLARLEEMGPALGAGARADGAGGPAGSVPAPAAGPGRGGGAPPAASGGGRGGPRSPSGRQGVAGEGGRPGPRLSPSDPDSAAASVSPPLDGPAGTSDPAAAEDLFARFLARLRAAHTMLVVQFAGARALGIEGRKLKIALASTLSLDMVSERESRERMEEVLAQVTGERWKLDFSRLPAVGPAGAPAGASASRAALREKQRELRKVALEDPLVSEAVRLFDGDVIEVKPSNEARRVDERRVSETEGTGQAQGGDPAAGAEASRDEGAPAAEGGWPGEHGDVEEWEPDA